MFVNQDSLNWNSSIIKGCGPRVKRIISERFFMSAKAAINPFIQFAQPKDAYEISQMFKEAYNGTYPLKEMEDEKQIAKMINNPNFHWLIFKTDFYDTVGCFGIQLEFEKRRGKHFGFVIRRKYQGKTNIMNILS